MDDLWLSGVEVDEEDELPQVVFLQGVESCPQPFGEGFGLGDSALIPVGRDSNLVWEQGNNTERRVERRGRVW